MLKCLKYKDGQSGLALISTLVCLAMGSMVVGASLQYVDTIFKTRAANDAFVDGLYAADAGVEHVLWSLKHGTAIPAALPTAMNENQAIMQTQFLGTYTLCAGEWVLGSTHSDWLLLTSEVAWVETEGAYRFTTTVTWNATGNTVIHLSEIGAKLPPGYSYRTGSAADFEDSLSDGEPELSADPEGAVLAKWVFSSPNPSVRGNDRVKTQSFYIDGSGDIEGQYSWVVAVRQDIGYVSEVNGSVYRITSTSTRGGDVTARIVSDAMLSMGQVKILSWESGRN